MFGDRFIVNCFTLLAQDVGFHIFFEKVSSLNIFLISLGISFQTFAPTYEILFFEISNCGLGICRLFVLRQFCFSTWIIVSGLIWSKVENVVNVFCGQCFLLSMFSVVNVFCGQCFLLSVIFFISFVEVNFACLKLFSRNSNVMCPIQV